MQQNGWAVRLLVDVPFTGANVMVHYRSASAGFEAIVATFNVLPGSAQCQQADLSDTDALFSLVTSTVERFGRLDALVNNQTSFYATPLAEIDCAAWDDLLGSNLKAPLFLTQAAAPHLKAAHGAVVNITDIHAERPLAGYPLYCVAKAGFAPGRPAHWRSNSHRRSRVNAVAPGPILWPDENSLDTAFDGTTRDKNRNPYLRLKRDGRPEDIARAVRFLLEDVYHRAGD